MNDLEAVLSETEKAGPIERMVVSAMETARTEAIEECAKHIECCGWRYSSQGFDIVQSLRNLIERKEAR